MPEPQTQIVRYCPSGRTLKAFHESPAFVRGIRGPIGAGKTTACVLEVLRMNQAQEPSPDGVCRSRTAIIRNTYGELKTTTLKTWGDWCPPHFGRLVMDAPIVHHIKSDGFDMEILFLALDRDEDVKRLLSLELTNAFINEAREVPKAILDALTGRVGRYPSKAQGGATRPAIVMDTNPPDTEHWWHRLAEEETPPDWEFFAQPAGDGPDAENLENLPQLYYERATAGKDEDWVKVYVRGEYGFVMDGKPVYPMWRDRTHVAPEPLDPVESLPLLIGADWGLTPAAVIAQRLANGRWLVIDELVTSDMGAVRFAELLSAHLGQHYPSFEAECWGDPAGEARAQTDERTVLEIMTEYTGRHWQPAPTNDATMRREVVANALSRLIDGDPAFLLSPKCAMLRKGFAGGYHYRRVRTGSGEAYHDKPAKNEYSHPHDALQYLLLGGGEHHAVLRRERHVFDGPFTAATDFDVFAEPVA